MAEEIKVNKFDDEEYRQSHWHSCSHVMAQAVKRLWPEVKLAIGPSIKEGWYYDMLAPFAFTPEHMEKIEAEMKKICKENLKIERFELPRDEAIKLMEEKEEPFKVELCAQVPIWTSRAASRATRSSCSPATPRTGEAIPAARPCSASTASRSRRRKNWTRISSASKKRRDATTENWARNLDCSCSATKPPASRSIFPRA